MYVGRNACPARSVRSCGATRIAGLHPERMPRQALSTSPGTRRDVPRFVPDTPKEWKTDRYPQASPPQADRRKPQCEKTPPPGALGVDKRPSGSKTKYLIGSIENRLPAALWTRGPGHLARERGPGVAESTGSE
ncbi:hypothetical protein MRX96_026309 [Rhipicephalus microplus]